MTGYWFFDLLIILFLVGALVGLRIDWYALADRQRAKANRIRRYRNLKMMRFRRDMLRQQERRKREKQDAFRKWMQAEWQAKLRERDSVPLPSHSTRYTKTVLPSRQTQDRDAE